MKEKKEIDAEPIFHMISKHEWFSLRSSFMLQYATYIPKAIMNVHIPTNISVSIVL